MVLIVYGLSWWLLFSSVLLRLVVMILYMGWESGVWGMEEVLF